MKVSSVMFQTALHLKISDFIHFAYKSIIGSRQDNITLDRCSDFILLHIPSDYWKSIENITLETFDFILLYIKVTIGSRQKHYTCKFPYITDFQQSKLLCIYKSIINLSSAMFLYRHPSSHFYVQKSKSDNFPYRHPLITFIYKSMKSNHIYIQKLKSEYLKCNFIPTVTFI